MARVDAWFEDWKTRHTERHPRSDWPEPESEYWVALESIFVHKGVQEIVADAASVALMEHPPERLSKHGEALFKAIREVWARSEVAAEAPSEREAAERLSKGCDDCGGHGITVRFRRRSKGALGRDSKPLPDPIQLYCRCPMGRWVERNHRERSPELRRRFYDLEDYVWLWGQEYRYPEGIPSHIQSESGEAPWA